MPKFALLSLCYTWVSHGCRVHISSGSADEELQPAPGSRNIHELRPLRSKQQGGVYGTGRAFATLLLAFNPTGQGLRSAAKCLPGDVLFPRVDVIKRTGSGVVSRLQQDEGLNRRSIINCALTAAMIGSTLPAIALGPSSLSGKPRPELGVVLIDPASDTGSVISADLVCDGGVAATVTFDSDLRLAKGNYYDLEVNNKDSDSVYVQVAVLPKGKSLDTLPLDFFRTAIFGETGRFSSYGAPSDVQLTDNGSRGLTRLLDVKFEVLSAAGNDITRRGTIAAVQPTGSQNVLMIVGSAAATRWKKTPGVEAVLRKSVESFQVVKTRPSKLVRSLDSDYRYASRGVKEDGSLDPSSEQYNVRFARELSSKAGSLAGVPLN